MPRLRNAATGVVVVVDDTTAARLGPGWGSVDKPAPAPARKPPAKRSRKSDDE